MHRVSTMISICLIGLSVLLSAGCAQVAHKVDVLYAPIATYRGGTGALELVNSDDRRDSSSEPALRWVLGQIKDSEGVASGDIISSIRPQDVIADAFKQELVAAGYHVSSAKKVDKYTGKGVVITNTSVQLDEVPSITRLESSCTILLNLELWKSGAVVKRFEYRSRFSDIAVVDRELLPRSLFQKAIQEIMHQALPDILQNLH